MSAPQKATPLKAVYFSVSPGLWHNRARTGCPRSQHPLPVAQAF